MVSIDQKINLVHAVKVECLLVLLQKHLQGIAQELVLTVRLKHPQRRTLVPFHHMELGAKLREIEKQLCHVERMPHQPLVHQLSVQSRIHREAAKGILHQVHLGKGRRDGRARDGRQSTIGIADHIDLIGTVLVGQRDPSLAGGLIIIG